MATDYNTTSRNATVKVLHDDFYKVQCIEYNALKTIVTCLKLFL